ncbi:MAG: CxxxxCH/CxxCH domain-containing protein [Deltaproteobacteria bacterium]|nr:CxxxxCH/CxxCH domain-containing protein [Deltaproteobacteria bacterium]
MSDRTLSSVAIALAALGMLMGCEAATFPASAPTFEQVSPILEASCAECHGGQTPAAGWAVTRYIDVIGCAQDQLRSPTLPGDESSMLIAVLDQEDHAGLLTGVERATLLAWLEAGAPSRPPAMHPIGFADPRSDEFHGAVLRAERWQRMLDPSLPGSCGRCHEGAPTRPEGVTGTAYEAPTCTSCHDEADGVLACSTCHGSKGHAYPPRDACFFGADAGNAGVHAKHVDQVGLECSVCHGEHTTDFSGIHGDGVVQVVFSDPRAENFPDGSSSTASYNEVDKTCTVGCHDRGGDEPIPTWSADLRLNCNSCHQAPPPDHFAGACSDCHAEPNADGTALTPGPLHANGQVDLGDGSGDCTACHGVDEEGWPADGAHPSHREPTLRIRVPCDSCHIVPITPLDPGHFDDTPGPEVTFSGLATARGATPSYDGSGCSDVACHGAGLSGGRLTSPVWTADDGAAAQCGACHSIPPPAPHPDSSSCASAVCHGDEIVPTDPPMISPPGRSLHIDGIVQHGRGTP